MLTEANQILDGGIKLIRDSDLPSFHRFPSPLTAYFNRSSVTRKRQRIKEYIHPISIMEAFDFAWMERGSLCVCVCVWDEVNRNKRGDNVERHVELIDYLQLLNRRGGEGERNTFLYAYIDLTLMQESI